LLGLLIATFLAAYMSTIASQLNWGTSYITTTFTGDLYAKSREKHFVLVSRIAMLLMIVFFPGGYKILPDDHFRSLGIYYQCQRRYGRRADSALVLVADQRLVGLRP
jgi:Na+/proline symporter